MGNYDMYANARFVRADHSALSVEIDGAVSHVPASMDNRHYRDMIAAGVTIAAYAEPQPGVSDYAEAIERHMDAVAQSLGYKNADRLASYVASSNAGWASEAAAFSAWRDDVWIYAYEQMALVQSGQRAAPSISQFLMELPSNTSDADGVLQRIENLENALGEFVARRDAESAGAFA